MDWSDLLAKAGIAEPPGRPELIEQLRVERDVEGVGGEGQRPAKPKRRRGKR